MNVELPDEGDLMVRVDNLKKDVKKASLLGGRVSILRGVSLQVPANHIFAVIGPNGAGKSTLIKAILDFIRPTSGTITLKAGARIGYLPENPYFYDYLTFRELLWFSLKAFNVDSRYWQQRIEDVAMRVGLSSHLKKQVRTFSKGMRQRAGIAAAIVHDPDFVILDEPMSGLDPLGRKMVFDLILELKKRGKTILFCSHILSDVERLCDDVVIMHQGEVKKSLSHEELVLAQKGMEIIVKKDEKSLALPESKNRIVSKTEDYLSIFIDSSKINEVLKELSDRDITVFNIKTSEIMLEKIFDQVVL